MKRRLAFLDHPPLLFAAAYVGYIGQNGGLGLAMSVALFLLISLSLLLPTAAPQLLRYRAFDILCHKATPQALVGVMCLSSIPAAIFGTGLPPGAALFLASTFLYMISNFCVAYQFATDFRPLVVTRRNFFMVPQLWTTSGHVSAMLFNGGPTIFALPLVAAMAWLGFRQDIGRWTFSRATASYMGAAYNIWYTACNITGPAPNMYVVASCLSCAVACCLLANRVRAGEALVAAELATALEVAQAQEAPIEPILVELPNVTFSLAAQRHWNEAWCDGIFAPPPLFVR